MLIGMSAPNATMRPVTLWLLLLVVGSAIFLLGYVRLARADPRVMVMSGKQKTTKPRYNTAVTAGGWGLAGGGAWSIALHRIANGWQQGAVLVLLMLAAAVPAMTAGFVHDRRVRDTLSSTK